MYVCMYVCMYVLTNILRSRDGTHLRKLLKEEDRVIRIGLMDAIFPRSQPENVCMYVSTYMDTYIHMRVFYLML